MVDCAATSKSSNYFRVTLVCPIYICIYVYNFIHKGAV